MTRVESGSSRGCSSRVKIEPSQSVVPKHFEWFGDYSVNCKCIVTVCDLVRSDLYESDLVKSVVLSSCQSVVMRPQRLYYIGANQLIVCVYMHEHLLHYTSS